MAASTGIYPPAQNSDQSNSPLIARAIAHPHGTVEHDDTTITYSTGTSELLYRQATWVDGYIVAVLKPDNASWKPFAPPRTGTSTYTGRSKWATCDRCFNGFTVTDSVCHRCGMPRCPRGHCACADSAGERVCPRCTMTLDKARFANFSDPATPCRDCA